MVRALVLCSLLLCLADCEEPPFRIVAQIDGSWLLSIAADDERVLCAGGRPGQGMTPGEGLVARLRGTAAPLEQWQSPVPGMLWWVHNLGGGVAWFAGEAGVVLRYDEGAGAQPLSLVPTGTKAVLYGLWAFSDSDVWAVGGDDQQGGVILHGDRGGLAIDGSAPRTGVLYKIFAPDPQHLFVVGAGGALLRYVKEGEGGRWLRDVSPLPPNERLLTVHGRSKEDVYAVGGLGMARLLHFDGATWTLVPTPGLGGLNGVFAEERGLLLAGNRGLLASGPPGGPFAPRVELTTDDLHAVFALGRTRYAVGGNLSQFGVLPARGLLLVQP